jgi:acyl dehydratase
MDPAYLLSLPPRVTTQRFTKRDTILYALGIGAAQDGEASELRFVYEEILQALPTMAVVLAYGGFWLKEPQYGVDWKRVLHAEESVILHRPLPSEGEVRGEMSIEKIVDKGAAKGALLYWSRRIFMEGSGELLATVRQVSFLRGDGGTGGSAGSAPPPHQIPERSPDLRISLSTRREQALIYRLSGDYNPLHADPAVAAEAGLPRPILHGLCTFGVAGRAVLQGFCGNDPARMRRLDGRFTAPVYPGDQLDVWLWRQDDAHASYQVRVAERNAIVLNNGYAEFLG